MTLMEFLHRVVGLDYRDGGRDWSGVDCWGLIALAYWDVLGVELSDYGDVAPEDALSVRRAIQGGAAQPPWQPVPDPAPMDVALIRLPHGRTAGHVGLVVPGGMILHAQRAAGIIQERAARPTLRPRIIGYVRHESCTS